MAKSKSSNRANLGFGEKKPVQAHRSGERQALGGGWYMKGQASRIGDDEGERAWWVVEW